MNSTIESMTNHRSIRSYSDRPVSPEILDAILDSAQSAPSSMNGQQVSIILVTDPDKRKSIAEYAGQQSYVEQAPVFMVFLADYHRAYLAAKKHGTELIIPESVESTLVGSIDVALSMGNAMNAAESLGLGTVFIGGIRRNPEKMIEILDLPKYVYPMVGICIGYAKEENIPSKKPRFPREAIVHENKYNVDMKTFIDDYDETMSAYMHQRTNGQETRGWSDNIAATYQKVYFPKVSPSLQQQGFLSK